VRLLNAPQRQFFRRGLGTASQLLCTIVRAHHSNAFARIPSEQVDPHWGGVAISGAKRAHASFALEGVGNLK